MRASVDREGRRCERELGSLDDEGRVELLQPQRLDRERGCAKRSATREAGGRAVDPDAHRCRCRFVHANHRWTRGGEEPEQCRQIGIANRGRGESESHRLRIGLRLAAYHGAAHTARQRRETESPRSHHQLRAHVVDPRSLTHRAVHAHIEDQEPSAGDAHPIDSDTATRAASWRREHGRSSPSAVGAAEDRYGEPVETHFRDVDRSLEE